MRKTAKKDKIIEDLKLEVDSLSTKIEKLEKLQDQQEQYSRRNCLVHGIGEEKEEFTDEVIINILNEKLGLDNIAGLREDPSNRTA